MGVSQKGTAPAGVVGSVRSAPGQGLEMCLGPCVGPGEEKVTLDAWWVGASWSRPGERLVSELVSELEGGSEGARGNLEAGFLPCAREIR